MTPSLFAGTDAVDEFTFMATPYAEQKLEKHRQTFITESDFKWLHEHSVNALRIPVGYWVLEGDAPYLRAVRYLDWAMEMAERYKLHTIIDVHGLPGSQNGRDHSGRKGKAGWLRQHSLRRSSLDILEQIARRYRDNPYFWGLQITNEPKLGLFQFKLRDYYRKAYDRLSQVLRPHTRVVFSDAFTPRLMSGGLKRRSHPVVMDVHLYHMSTLFSGFMSADWYLGKIERWRELLAKLARDQSVIVGEWSGVMRGETMKNKAPDQREAITQRHLQTQLAAYENAAGWFYWSYKTEKPGLWNFRSLIESGKLEIPRSS